MGGGVPIDQRQNNLHVNNEREYRYDYMQNSYYAQWLERIKY